LNTIHSHVALILTRDIDYHMAQPVSRDMTMT